VFELRVFPDRLRVGAEVVTKDELIVSRDLTQIHNVQVVGTRGPICVNELDEED
jgi:hypothetical protein